jgi:WD40 repeat protein
LILLVVPAISQFWINRSVWIRHDPGLGTKRYLPVLPSWICVSPDESRIAFSTRDSVVVIDSKSGREIFHTPTSAEIVAISHDGRRLVTGGQGEPVCLFDMDNGKKLAEVPGADHRTAEAILAVSKDGSRMIVRSNDRISLWDSTSGGASGDF